MKEKNKDIRFLIIGPMLSPDGSNLGGATISLDYLIEFIRRKNISYELINTQHFKSSLGKLFNAFYVFYIFLLKIRKTDIVFINVSQFGTKTISPILYLLTRLFGKKFVFRPFGGAMRDHYEKYNSWQRRLFENTLLQADIFYLQTRDIVEYFSPKGKNIQQLTTSRYTPPDSYLRPNRPFQKKFVFLGHINEDKGLDYLLEAFSRLDDSYSLHIYGSIHDDKYRSIFEQTNVYQGALSKEKMMPKLKDYDVLILPTFYRGEGHPGAIIEAYSVGLPVITTDWRAIPEVIEEGKTGLVIPIKSTNALIKAVEIFDENNYPLYSKNALEHFQNNFNAEIVNQKVIQKISDLLQ
jgi:glycosyltransferase involved in cell wall biosynthesis